MGPEATVLLMQRIIDATPATSDREHIPMLVDNNTLVPSRIDALIHGTGDSPGPVLARMAQNLSAAGAECLIMPCNTAHHYAGDITSAADIPFLNMVKLTAKKLGEVLDGNRRVGILASPAVRIIGLFETAFNEQNLTAIYPEDDAPLLQAIEEIKNLGPVKSATMAVNQVAKDLQRREADAVILACTEFSLLRDDLSLAIPILDTLDILTECTVAYAVQPQAV